MSAVLGTTAGAAEPGNNNFASATALPDDTSTGSTTGSNLDATIETGEPVPYTGNSATVWWTWKAPSTGTFMFDTCGSNFTTGLGIYTGTAVNALTNVAGLERECYYQGNWYWNQAWEFNATAGVTYRIQVAGDQGAMGSIVLRWWPYDQPDNDNFSAAATLPDTAKGSVSGTNRFATSATTDPLFLIDRGSVWYSWTPPASDTYMFDTCGSSIDSKIGVYTQGISGLTELATGDDDCDYQSMATFNADYGTTYYIGVSGWDEDTGGAFEDVGDFTLRWQSDTPPDNDDFVDAIALPETTSGTAAAGNTRFATAEPGEPTAELGDYSVWWTWKAPESGSVIFDDCGGNNQYTGLAAFTGTAVNDLTLITDNWFGCFQGSQLQFQAEAGTTYVIGAGYGQSDVPLHWQMGSAPSNDNFASAAALVGDGGTVTASNLFATAETDEPYELVHSVWWKWVAPSADPVTFDDIGTATPSPRLRIYTGSAPNALTLVTGTTDNSVDGHQAFTFTPSSGTMYYIALGDSDGGMGDLVLHWPASAVPGMPGIPTGITATAGSEKALVTWTAPGNTGDGISSYEVRYRQTGTETWSEEGLTGTADIVTGLTNDVTYEFQVRAISTLDGAWSSSVTATPRALAVNVTNITAGKSAVTVTFTVTGGTWFNSSAQPVAQTRYCSISGTTINVACTSGVAITGVPGGLRTVTVSTTDGYSVTASDTSTQVRVKGPPKIK